MILTRLEAQNFLSFDSVDIAFGPGINVIVGPNGAGKTNVLRVASTALTLLLAAGTAEPDRSLLLTSTAWDRLVPRIGSGRSDGWLAASICLDDEQLDRLALFIRAVAEVKAYEGVTRRQNDSLPSDWVDLIMARLPVSELETLRNGRVVLTFNRSANPQFTISYEFVDVSGAGQSYHCVLGGQDMPGTLRPGLSLSTSMVSSSPADPPIIALDLSTEEGRSQLGFSSLLPRSGSTSWSLHGTNAQQHPLTDACLEVFRPELLSAGFMWSFPFGGALADVIRPRLRLTEGSRQPPRFLYEPWPGFELLDRESSGTVPLQLYRLALGTAPERREFQRICGTFRKLTGLELSIYAREEVRASGYKEQLLPSTDVAGHPQLAWQRVEDQPAGVLRCEPRVAIGDGDVRIDMAGAGALEALTNITLATPGDGGIAILDEPATNMFPTRQRDFLAHLAGLRSAQFLMVTHSNYLVPVSSEFDLQRTTRLRGGSGEPTVATQFSIPPNSGPGQKRHQRSRAFARLAAADDVRAALFASAVIAVEGESEQVLLPAFLNNPTIVGDHNTLDALGYHVLDIHGDSRCGPYLDVLLGFRVPFIILTDGPALRPNSRLDLDLRERGIVIPVSRTNEAFRRRRHACEAQGLFTLASCFGPAAGTKVTCTGCKHAHAEAKPGEIEWWVHRHFRAAYHAAHAAWIGGRSHPKAGVMRQIMASEPPRPGSPPAREMTDLYQRMQRVLRGGGLRP